jgi:glycosyltransferase involved in cell wall biosynthesis
MANGNKLKIVQFISSLGKGGAERLVVDLCNELANNSAVQVFLCTYNEYGHQPNFKDEISPAVTHINLRKNGRFNFSFQVRLIRFLRKEKPDIINSHLSGTVLFLYIPALFFGKIKFFHTIHNLAEEELPGKFMQFLRKLIYKTNRIQTVSISNTTELSHLKLYGKQSPVIHNGVKKKEKTPKFEEVINELNAFKEGKDTKIFLSIGRINSRDDQKNFGLLVDVFKALDKAQFPAVLIIIGSDTSSDKETLNALIKRKSKNVFFIGSRNNISDYMLNSDFFCLSSKFEGLPITIIEALSFGLPVISTNVGGIGELINDNENGFLVDSLELNSYYKKITELLRWDQNKLASTRLKNQKKFEDHFNIKKTSKDYLSLYIKYMKNKVCHES